MSVLWNWCTAQRIIWRDKHLAREMRSDVALRDFRQNLAMTGLRVGAIGGMTAVAALHHHPIITTSGMVGMTGVALRFGAYLDMFATQRVKEGNAGIVSKAVEVVFKHSPYRYISSVRLQALEQRRADLVFIDRLLTRTEEDRPRAEARERDIGNLDRISHFMNPFHDLEQGAISAFGFVVTVSQQFGHWAAMSSNRIDSTTLLNAAVATGSALFAAAELGVFTTKRKAAGDIGITTEKVGDDINFKMHPIHRFLLRRAHKAIMATPLRGTSWLILRWQEGRLAQMDLSPVLKDYMDQRGLTRQFKVLKNAAQSPDAMRRTTYQEAPSV